MIATILFASAAAAAVALVVASAPRVLRARRAHQQRAAAFRRLAQAVADAAPALAVTGYSVAAAAEAMRQFTDAYNAATARIELDTALILTDTTARGDQ